VKRLALFVLLAAAGAAYAGKFRWHEVAEGDGTNNYQIYILGDGWTHGEMGKYHEVVDSVVAKLKKIKPFDYIWHSLRITCVDVASDVKGCTIYTPTQNYKENDKEDRENIPKRKSPLGVTFQTNKKLENDPGMSEAAKLVKAELGENWGNIAVIIINEPQFEAGATQNHDGRVFIGVTAFGGDKADVAGVLAHEMGHGFFSLADEYCDGREGIKKGNLSAEKPNITMEDVMEERKWRHIPGSGLIACQALGKDFGWKHAFSACRMQLKGDKYAEDFCAVCLEAMTQDASAKYQPIVSHSPPSKDTIYAQAFGKVTFKVTLRGATREYARVWTVNGRALGAGQVQSNDTGSTTEVTLDYPALSTGINKVTFLVEDRRNVLLPVGTPVVRKAPHTVSWWVVMAGPPHLLPVISPMLGWP
jgi:hypothetical protein